MTTYNLSVLYPNNDETKFDKDYYLSTHMPLVDKIWKPLGLLKWDIVEPGVDKDGNRPPYCMVAVLTWKDEASYAAAMTAPATPEVLGDIPKFYNQKPVIFSGKFVASG